MSVTLLHNGLPQHHNTARDYARFIDHLAYLPDLTESDLAASLAVVIACRSDNDQVARHAELLRRYLADGGFLIVMGGVRADLIDPRATFIPSGTNFTWFMQPNPDSGHRVRNAAHGLHRYLAISEMQWHRHGYYQAPPGAQTLVELCHPHGEERLGDILYDDRHALGGRLMATTLDPHMHHGGHYIPAATRFLNGFYPWLRAEIGLPIRFNGGGILPPWQGQG